MGKLAQGGRRAVPVKSSQTGTRKKHRSNPGANVSYALTFAAIVRFTVKHDLSGRKQGHGKTARCVARTHSNRNVRRCTRVVTLRGFFTQTGKPGANSLRFSGRLTDTNSGPGPTLWSQPLPPAA